MAWITAKGRLGEKHSSHALLTLNPHTMPWSCLALCANELYCEREGGKRWSRKARRVLPIFQIIVWTIRMQHLNRPMCMTPIKPQHTLSFLAFCGSEFQTRNLQVLNRYVAVDFQILLNGLNSSWTFCAGQMLNNDAILSCILQIMEVQITHLIKLFSVLLPSPFMCMPFHPTSTSMLQYTQMGKWNTFMPSRQPLQSKNNVESNCD